MSKMKELAQIVSELKEASKTISDLADSITEMFTDTAEAEPVKKEAKEQKPAMTLPEIRAVLAEKSRAGFTAEIRELLKKHGADRLSEIDPKEYEALKAEAEVLHAD